MARKKALQPFQTVLSTKLVPLSVDLFSLQPSNFVGDRRKRSRSLSWSTKGEATGEGRTSALSICLLAGSSRWTRGAHRRRSCSFATTRLSLRLHSSSCSMYRTTRAASQRNDLTLSSTGDYSSRRSHPGSYAFSADELEILRASLPSIESRSSAVSTVCQSILCLSIIDQPTRTNDTDCSNEQSHVR